MNDDSMTSPNDEDVAPAVPLERCFLFSDGRLRANANGRKRFGERFRRAGFDIDKIRTYDELQAALEGSWHIVVADLERELDRRAPAMDPLAVTALRAVLDGDYDGFSAAIRKLSRRRALKVVAEKNKAP